MSRYAMPVLRDRFWMKLDMKLDRVRTIAYSLLTDLIALYLYK
jgi:hypothetical protein